MCFKLYFQNVKGALSAKIVFFVTHKNYLDTIDALINPLPMVSRYDGKESC